MQESTGSMCKESENPWEKEPFRMWCQACKTKTCPGKGAHEDFEAAFGICTTSHKEEMETLLVRKKESERA